MSIVRLTYLFGFIVISALLLTSIWFQIFDGIMPCPLCTLQRISFGMLGILFFTGIFTWSRRGFRFFINSFAMLISAFGIFLAGRQVWLQHFPSGNNSECGVSLQYMIEALPMNEVIRKIFSGSAECSARGWEFLHLNMAEWALAWFIAFLILSLCLFVEELRWKKK